MASAEAGYQRMSNPIDIVEQVAHTHGWACDRTADDEVTLIVAGSWTDYHLSLNWRDDLEVLHLACAFDFKVPDNRLPEIYKLIAQINEQLWLGHFELWSGSGLIVFRHAALVGEGDTMSFEHAEAISEAAIEECERFYPVFQFVLWGGKSPGEAISAALIDTAGEA